MKRTTVVAALLLCVGPAFAVDPAKRISQYAHTAWHIEDGVFGGAPHAITQTADGYIWIGTDAGLVRFDGVRFVPWEPPDKSPAISPVFSLLGGHDGTLWIGSMGAKPLSAVKNNRLMNFPIGRGRINSIVEDHAGAVWVTRSRTGDDHTGGICQVAGDRLRCFGNSDGMDLPYADPLAADSLGNLWVGSSRELLRWSPKSWNAYFRKQLEPYQGLAGVEALAVGQDKSIWVGFSKTPLGLQHIVGSVAERVDLPGLDVSKRQVYALLVDRHNSLWMGTSDDGLYRIRGKEVDHFSKEDGLTGNSVEGIFEDAEDNLWVVTGKGLDVFRDTRVTTFSTREGLSSDHVQSVLAARDGSIWTGNVGSLDVLRGNKVTSIRRGDGLPGQQVTSLFEDHEGRIWVGVDRSLTIYEHGKFRSIPGIDGRPLGIVTGISEDADQTIWVLSNADPGPRVFRIAGDRVVEEFNQSEIPRARVVAPDPRGGVWFGLDNGSLARYRAGKLEIVAKDLTPGSIHYITVDVDGSVWISGRNGLSGWRDGVVKRLGSTNGLPCEAMFAAIKDDAGSFWLYSKCGLISISASEVDRWWQKPESKIRIRVFDVFDGAQPADSTFLPQASKSPDGRLWFANDTTLQSIDPRHLDDNRLIPPVHIEEAIADGKTYAPGQALHLPPRTRDLEIDYAALSFRVPQKVRFRYKLEGRNPQWQDAGLRRQVFFSDLPPGPYTFRVIACNNDGIWNEAGDSWTFNIAPTFYQTHWFQSMLALTGIGMIGLFYHIRVRQITARADLRYAERLEERTRIARELHDTMLQSLQASLFHMQAGRNLLAGKSDGALQAVDEAIAMAEGAIEEGRDAVGELRSSPANHNDLAESLKAVGDELAAGATVTFQLMVTGAPRELHRAVQDEIYRIGSEALRNAFKHGGAQRIEADICYSERQVRLQIRDDGVGIGPGVLEGGRSNHYGLSGMRERSEKIGAKLEIWSATGSGSEIDLSIPAARAYRASPAHPLRRSLKR